MDELEGDPKNGLVEVSMKELVGVSQDGLERIYREEISWVTPVKLVIDSIDELEGVSQDELERICEMR